LIGIGNFGSRTRGGVDAGSPRYIYVKYNKKLGDTLFPPQDDWLLPYVFDEGQRCEPLYYVPVLPMSVLENMQIPATGWRICIWARDINFVIKNVKKMIKGEIDKCKRLPLWLRGNSSTISNCGNYMIGKYTV
jgi:DNA topoisomerase-2